MGKKKRILYIDDNELDRELVRDALVQEHDGFELTEAATREQFERLIGIDTFDAVLSDFNILGFEGLDVIRTVRQADPRVPVVIITGTGSEKIAVEALQSGAADYVIKRPHHIRRLPQTLLSAIEMKALLKEREDAKKERDLAHERLTLALRSSRVGLWDWDPVTGALFVSREWKEQIGYQDHELAGTYEDWEENLHPEDREATLRALKAYLDGKADRYDREFRFRHRNGTWRWIQARGEVLLDEAGQPRRMLGCHVDITERKHAEEALERHRQELEDMVEARTRELREAQKELVREERLATLGRLAGGVGHELRNPLGVVKNAVYFLNMALRDPDPEVRETLDIVQREIASSEAIIRSLFEFAEARAPKCLAGLDVNERIRGALSLDPVPSRVDAVLDLPEDLPPIAGDPEQLEQVFRSLIRNAVQAMPTGGRLALASSLEPGWIVRVRISDTGEGIAEEHLARVFEPLFTTRAKGIGLGLALCRTYVEAHGGRIGVVSEPGKGSSFTVDLPSEAGKGDSA